jgi:hypothetical protein
VSGNVLTLTNFPGNNALAAATGSASFNVVTYGFSPLEILGYYNTSNHNTIQPQAYTNLDLETNAAVANSMVTLSSCRGVVLDLNFVNSGSTATIVHRVSNGVIVQGNDINTVTFDIDTSFGNPYITLPRYQLGQTANFTGNVGVGMSTLSHNATDTRAVSGGLLGYFSGNTYPEMKFNKNNSALEFANFPISIPTTQLTTGTAIPPATPGQTSSIVCAGSSTGTLALPTISANGDGELYFISNPQSGTWTITCTQNIIGGGATTNSYSLAGQTDALFRGNNNAGTLYYSVR